MSSAKKRAFQLRKAKFLIGSRIRLKIKNLVFRPASSFDNELDRSTSGEKIFNHFKHSLGASFFATAFKTSSLALQFAFKESHFISHVVKPHFLIGFNGLDGVMKFRDEGTGDDAIVDVIKEVLNFESNIVEGTFGRKEDFSSAVVKREIWIFNAKILESVDMAFVAETFERTDENDEDLAESAVMLPALELVQIDKSLIIAHAFAEIIAIGDLHFDIKRALRGWILDVNVQPNTLTVGACFKNFFTFRKGNLGNFDIENELDKFFAEVGIGFKSFAEDEIVAESSFLPALFKNKIMVHENTSVSGEISRN